MSWPRITTAAARRCQFTHGSAKVEPWPQTEAPDRPDRAFVDPEVYTGTISSTLYLAQALGYTFAQCPNFQLVLPANIENSLICGCFRVVDDTGAERLRSTLRRLSRVVTDDRFFYYNPARA
jgi:hypothetical protein